MNRAADEDQPILPPDVLEAARWCVQLKEKPADACSLAFTAWRQAAPEHAALFADAMRVTPMTTRERRQIEYLLGETFPPLFGRTEPPAPSRAVVPSTPAGRPHPPGEKRAAARRWASAGWAAAAAVALMLGLHPDSPVAPLLSPAQASSYMSPPGVIRHFRLEDGSRLILDSDSRVLVKIDRTQRELRLLGGRARIAVRADRRAFTIRAGVGEVLAHRGVIDAQSDATGYVEVILRAGHGTLTPRPGRPGGDIRLTVGQAVAYNVKTSTPILVDPAHVDARDWPEGWADYRAISLGALVKQANRYARTPVVLDDPALAALPASGRFQLTDSQRFTRQIAELFDLDMIARADGLHLRRHTKSLK